MCACWVPGLCRVLWGCNQLLPPGLFNQGRKGGQWQHCWWWWRMRVPGGRGLSWLRPAGLGGAGNGVSLKREQQASSGVLVLRRGGAEQVR